MLKAILAALVVTCVIWEHHHRARKVLRLELERLQTEWAAVDIRLQEAKTAQPQFFATINQGERLAAEIALPRWTAALRNISECTVPEIKVRDIRVAGASNDPENYVIHLGGPSTAEAPRLIADHFRQALQGKLERQFRCVVKTTFTRLDDEPALPRARPDQRTASFAITAAFRLAGQILRGQKET